MRARRTLSLILCCIFSLSPSHASPTSSISNSTNSTINALSGPALAVDTDQLAVFTTRNQQAGWPVILGTVLRGGPTNATISWSFPQLGSVLCTVSGVVNQSCAGPVLDVIFPSAGSYGVSITITDASTNALFTTQTFSVNISTGNAVPTGTRREVRDLTTGQWSRFVQAAHVLKTFGVWDHIARLHSAAMQDKSMERSASHGGPSFLPWHRAFIRVTELCLQTAGNDMSITLPYWDWTFDQPSFASSPILTDSFFGGNGDPSVNGAVTSGHFCDASVSSCPSSSNWPVPVEFGGPTLRRTFAADLGATISTQAQMDALTAVELYDQSPFDANSTAGFRAGMEGWILGVYGEMHNGIHRWLGGQFSNVPTSFFDPVFVAHHANIDRHWYAWQQAKGCVDWNDGCYAPIDDDPLVNSSTPGAAQLNGTWRIPGHQWSDHMWPWGIAPKDVATASIYSTWYTYADRGTLSTDAPMPIVAGEGAIEFVSAAPNGFLEHFVVLLYVAVVVSIAVSFL
ncbi:Di-copper centre-containing protein [Dacryopinax primogenitus]|uniref:Di-copper centre-containing protein n=1 Tax=Dacryopinax primogenitus (strain DJM 731) TaxID=1858805 RepID=M5FY28_DACPD|nr:Di-copper centre-containing protein [Dacryopinax primogenitus]EJU02971.1 Di-copper centre-containing protein [Dacryopinax primogenitus]